MEPVNQLTKALVNESGNADVSVYVDTTPIAFAMLCCLHASGKFSDKEMRHMFQAFQELNRRASREKNHQERSLGSFQRAHAARPSKAKLYI
ncbi:MAG TPA: hypothetical protein VFK44_05855 [Bacillales bacterium]|nr:hypothetical protein [Bacillales bacterium]